jgi:hypothetical protein
MESRSEKTWHGLKDHCSLGEMAAVDDQVMHEINPGEAWGIGPREDVDGPLDDAGVRSWDSILETSLSGMERCLGTNN